MQRRTLLHGSEGEFLRKRKSSITNLAITTNGIIITRRTRVPCHKTESHFTVSHCLEVKLNFADAQTTARWHSINAAICCDLLGQSLSQTCQEQVAQNLFVLWKHSGVQLVAVNDRELFWPAWAMVSLTAVGWKVKDVSAGVTASGSFRSFRPWLAISPRELSSNLTQLNQRCARVWTPKKTNHDDILRSWPILFFSYTLIEVGVLALGCAKVIS